VVRDWLLVLLDGDARSRPRFLHHYLRLLHRREPFIACWSASRGHLREVTSDDRAELGKLRGWQLGTTISALRSQFRFPKKRGLILANPA
jgi:integrase